LYFNIGWLDLHLAPRRNVEIQDPTPGVFVDVDRLGRLGDERIARSTSPGASEC
jgi:hypothetical protein